MQAAINSLSGYGTIILGPGTFQWNSAVPTLPRSATGITIRGSGSLSTTVTGSSSAPRFLDCPYIADYDVYQNIEISDLTYDRQNLTQLTNTHILIGDLISGAWSQRVNFAYISIKRCRTINVPTATTANGLGNHHSISFASKHLGSGEATQTSLKHIRVEDCDFTGGGNVGVSIMGTGATPVNVLYDDIKIIRTRHDTTNTPTAFHGDACFQVGGTGFGGTVTLDGCRGANSGDVGVELDDSLKAFVINCEMVDCWNAGFFPNNFGGQTDIAGQTFTFRGCLSQKLNLGTGSTTSNGFRLGGNGSANTQLGRVVFEDCQHENLSQSLVAGDALMMSPTNPTAGYKSIVIRGFQVSISGFNQAITTLARLAAVQLAAPSGTTLFDRVSDLDVNFNITRGAGSTASLFIHALGVRGTGTCQHKIEGVTGSLTEASAVSTSTQLVSIGLDVDAGIHRGVLKGIGPHTVSGDGSPIGIRFGPSNTYGVLSVQDSDLSGASAGSEFSFATAGDSAKVRVARVRRRNGTVPAPSALTGLVTATGKALGTGYSCTVQFVQGSGSGITAIDISTDGGTTYTNLLTQASGAMPAGADLTVGPLTTDSLVKVTFATTQPTINMIPFEP